MRTTSWVFFWFNLVCAVLNLFVVVYFSLDGAFKLFNFAVMLLNAAVAWISYLNARELDR